jgi:hypothetical protein
MVYYAAGRRETIIVDTSVDVLCLRCLVNGVPVNHTAYVTGPGIELSNVMSNLEGFSVSRGMLIMQNPALLIPAGSTLQLTCVARNPMSFYYDTFKLVAIGRFLWEGPPRKPSSFPLNIGRGAHQLEF